LQQLHKRGAVVVEISASHGHDGLSASHDLYQLTMMAGYVAGGVHRQSASFELFIRRLPPHRAYVVSAGLDTAVQFIESLTFTERDVAWVRTVPALRQAPAAFFDYLRQFRFSGDVWAMREGTPFFPFEPILRVTAPLAEAQLLETALLAIVNFQSSIASKAARIVQAADGRPVMEFGARRAHGLDAGLHAARASYVAGCASTSFVEAGREFGIPLSGTMAHSWILAAASELEAFTRYLDNFGEHSVLLLDTYDTLEAARLIVGAGLRPPAVRLDSGDFLKLSQEVRRIFDAAGLHSTRILVSGDLDEHRIRDLVAAGAPVDGFGVGTALTTSEDAPALGGVYKLVQLQDDERVRDVMKRSPGKATWPGRKQVFREAASGSAVRDVIALDDESGAGRPLLEQVMANGRRVLPSAPLADVRQRAQGLIAELPAALHRLDAETAYRVDISTRLQQLQQARGQTLV
jgi:nicotinate phosphoribosyltransferase